MGEIIDQQTANAVLDALTAASKARIFEGNTQKPFGVQAITIPLTTARLETDPYVLNFPFRTLYVQSATDTGVNVNVRFQTRDQYQSAINMKRNDVFVADYPQSSVNLYWDAQSGKSITLVFFIDAEFRSGSLISVTSGGVSVSNGDSITQSNPALTAATATLVCAASTTRKQARLQNTDPANSIWLGPSTVTDSGTVATRGFELAPGEIFVWQNAAALYAYSVAGGNGLIHVSEEA